MGIYTSTNPGPNTFQRLLRSITGIDLGDYAIRGLNCAITPRQGDNLPYDVDGNLMDWSNPAYDKLAITISCSDFDPPVLTGIRQGTDITCVFEPGMGPVNQSDGTLYVETKLLNWNTTRDDYEGKTGWQLNLKEK